MRLRDLIRDAAADALYVAGPTRPRRFARGRFLCVTYHRVLPAEQRAAYPYPNLAVTPEELRWYLGFFTAHFTCGPLTELYRRFAAGERPARPFLALTFDDGQLDNYVHAAPCLAAAGVRASFYIPTGHVDAARPIWHDQLGFALAGALKRDPRRVRQLCDGLPPAASGDASLLAEALKARPPALRGELVAALRELAGQDGQVPTWAGMMTWEQVRELASRGHEIGSHTVNHCLLPQCDDRALAEELEASRARLQRALRREITSFCYPNGDHDERCVGAVARAGYELAVTTAWGRNDERTPPLRLRRCNMDAFYTRRALGPLSRTRLAWRLSGLHPGLAG